MKAPFKLLISSATIIATLVGCASSPSNSSSKPVAVVQQQPLQDLRTNMVEVGIDRSYKYTNSFGGTNGVVLSNNFSGGGEVTLIKVPIGSMELVPTLLGQPPITPASPSAFPPPRQAFQPYFTQGINP